jgi:membrane protein
MRRSSSDRRNAGIGECAVIAAPWLPSTRQEPRHRAK